MTQGSNDDRASLKRRWVGRLMMVAGLVGTVAAMPSPALAWWRGGGIGFGFVAPPIYFAPPAYYAPPPAYYAPPPAYYAPPPAYYAPPPVAYAPARWATSCDAGRYVCPMEVASPAGSPCTCPTNMGRIGGRSR